MKTDIIKLPKKHSSGRKISANNMGMNKTQWFNKQVTDLDEQKTKTYMDYKIIRTNEEYENYKRIRSTVNAKMREIKKA